MKNFGKVFSLVIISASLFLLALNTPVHALVIAAPLIAISAFKASVFLVSLMSFPVTALIHIFKRWGVLKTVIVSLAILGLAFGIAFGTLSLFKESSSKRMVGKDSGMGYVVSEAPSFADRVSDPAKPASFRVPRPYPPVMRESANWSIILLLYSVLTAALFVILLVPILIILIVVRKARNEVIGLKRILAVSMLFSVVIAIPLAFGLGLLYTLTSNSVVIY